MDFIRNAWTENKQGILSNFRCQPMFKDKLMKFPI